MRTRPPAAVLAAFAARDARLEPLASGQGTAWRADGVVLKPLDMSIPALRWQADVLSRVEADGFRVAAPLRAADGELAVEGWTAWPALAGAHAERWPEVVAVGERFHRALADVPRPHALLDAREDRWARADRCAWGDAPATPAEGAPPPQVAALLSARTELRLGSQLVHGDLSGNVLFADGLAPAIIDLSPYWRPAAWASAIVIVDAALWHAADPAMLTRFAERDDGAQLLLRASLFRLLCEPDPAAAERTHRMVVERVLQLCGR